MPSKHQSEPIVPAKEGRPPAFVVACLDCEFSHDAHGLTAEDAVKSIAPSHQTTHRLIARSVDYTTGWPENHAKPTEGPKTFPHALYRQ